MIKDIWRKADAEQHNAVISAIIAEGYNKQTAYSYCNGNRRPGEQMRINITSSINEVMNTNYTSEELFSK